MPWWCEPIAYVVGAAPIVWFLFDAWSICKERRRDSEVLESGVRPKVEDEDDCRPPSAKDG